MTTTLRDEVRKLWTEAFPGDPREWVDSFFSRVYRDEDAVVGRLEGQAVSSMLLQQYTMAFDKGAEIQIGYVSGAATRKSKRGRGFMSALMAEGLAAARRRGDSLVTLIPAHDWLYPFYERFGFATVFFVRVDRFTSAHRFSTEGEYLESDILYAPEVFAAFREFERQSPGWRVCHTQRDFMNILDDLHLDVDSGVGIAVSPSDGHIAGIAFATLRDGCVVVTDALGESSDARTGALQMLRRRWPDAPFKVLTPAPQEEFGGGKRGIFPRAMARIVNVQTLLEALAACAPEWKCTLCISDPILQENNGVFRCEGGKCTPCPGLARVDYAVDVTLLGKMLFSSKPMGELLGVPSARPHISLMLDY